LGIVNTAIVFPSTHNPSWFVFFNPNNFYIDKVFYGIEGDLVLCLIMNSYLFLLFAENFGYSLVGGGGSFLTVEDLKDLWIIKEDFNEKDMDFHFLSRECSPIFTELGFDPDKPIREQEPEPLPDRKALDDIVFDALDLTEEERKEVYYAVAELVQNRLKKARSV